MYRHTTNLLFDVDGTILQTYEDLFEQVLSNFQVKRGFNLNEIKAKDLREQFPEWATFITETFNSNAFWAELQPYPDMVLTINAIQDYLTDNVLDDIRIRFITSQWTEGASEWAYIRQQTLQRLFPWIRKDDLHITWDKPSVNGAVLVEDNTQNALRWISADIEDRFALVLDRPFNKHPSHGWPDKVTTHDVYHELMNLILSIRNQKR